MFGLLRYINYYYYYVNYYSYYYHHHCYDSRFLRLWTFLLLLLRNFLHLYGMMRCRRTARW